MALIKTNCRVDLVVSTDITVLCVDLFYSFEGNTIVSDYVMPFDICDLCSGANYRHQCVISVQGHNFIGILKLASTSAFWILYYFLLLKTKKKRKISAPTFIFLILNGVGNNLCFGRWQAFDRQKKITKRDIGVCVSVCGEIETERDEEYRRERY